MNDSIPLRDGGLGKTIMHKLHCIIEEEGLGGGFEYVETSVVVGRGENV